MAVQPFGSGRVVYVGSDEMWRMRYYKDSYYYRRFWSNVVNYLASLKARRVIITTGGDSFSVGDKINVEAEVFDKADYHPLKAEKFSVDLINRDTGEAKTLELKGSEARPGRFTLEYTAVHTGRYQVTALRDDASAAGEVAAKQFAIEPARAEMLRTEANEDVMRSIASRPENFAKIWDMDKLAIPPSRAPLIDDRKFELWDTKLSVILIVLLLTIEWILRKKYNMT